MAGRRRASSRGPTWYVIKVYAKVRRGAKAELVHVETLGGNLASAKRSALREAKRQGRAGWSGWRVTARRKG